MSPATPDPSPAVVRQARPEEYDAVGALTARAYRASGFGSPDYEPELRDAAGRAAHGELFVALVDEVPVGTAALFTAASGPRWAEHAGPADAVLRMLAVVPEARGHGAGTALTRACIERSRALGCHRLLLSTQPAMTAAHRIYEALGFRRTPERDWEPRPGLLLLTYVLDL